MAASTGRSKRFLRVFFLLALGFGWIVAAPADGDEPVTHPVLLGKLDRFPDDVAKRLGVKSLEDIVDAGPSGSLISYAARDRFLQIWTISDHVKLGTMTVIAERSFATLAITRFLTIHDRVAVQANSGIGSEYAHTLDTKNERLFLEYGGGAISPDERFGFMVIDLKTFDDIDLELPKGFVRNTELVQAVFGIEYDETADRLVLLLAGLDNNPSSTFNTVTLVGWDNEHLTKSGQLPGTQPDILGPRLLRNCRRDPINGLVINPKLTPILIAPGPDLDSAEVPAPVKTWVTIPCYSTAFSVNDVLVRLDRETMFDPLSRDEKAMPAPAAIAHWDMDTTHGRMYLLNASTEVDAWVYEVASHSFIGIIEMSPKLETSPTSIALGVDEKSGRLYAYGGGNSLMIAEAAQDPVPQADLYDIGTPRESGQATIAVDPLRSRILLVRGSSGPDSWLKYYEWYAVPPATEPPPPVDPDSLTKQVAEVPGQTIAEYGGNATTYGVRVLLAAGISGVVPSNGSDLVGTLYANANSRCGFRDREIALGAIPTTTLGSTVGFAQAESVRLDDNSVKDFGKPSRCDLYFQYSGPAPGVFPQIARDNLFFASFFALLDQKLPAVAPSEDAFNGAVAPRSRWDYRAADCTTKDGRDQPGQNSSTFAGDTRVTCGGQDTISAVAEGGAMTGFLGNPQSPLPLKVGRASSETKVYLDPKDGLVSVAVSRVEGIQIGPVSIGFIENRARAMARGRTGTAKTDEYEPVFGAVRGPGITGCEIKCSFEEIITPINNALSGRAEIRTLRPDRRLRTGSPGGYEAGIIKADKQRDSDNSLTGDKSREVPALEIIVYNDNPIVGRARQLVQFAGVRADAHYGIQVFEEGVPCPECEPKPEPEIVIVDGEPQIVTVDRPVQVPGPLRRVVFPVIPGGYRMLLANPRAAGAMATVWLLLLSPAVVASRRARLRQLS